MVIYLGQSWLLSLLGCYSQLCCELELLLCSTCPVEDLEVYVMSAALAELWSGKDRQLISIYSHACLPEISKV